MLRLLIGIIFTVITTLTALAQKMGISTESGLMERYQTEIKSFWQTGHFSSFSGIDGVEIHFAQFTSQTRDKCLLLVPGRSEGYLKYQELAFDLTNLGFNLFIIDHRGQGLSERMLTDSHKGFVEHFDHYSDDLNVFVENIVQPQCGENIYLLAHSMGGAISIRYLQRYITPIKAAVLSSPMIAINRGGLPLWLAESVITLGNSTSNLISDESWYFFGQGQYENKAFNDNPLMQSEIRYQLFTELYEKHPKLQLGGVTFRWLKEALRVRDDLFIDIDKLTTPTLVIQAGDDSVVDNLAQNHFCQQLHQRYHYSCPTGKPLVIKNAKHEIFFEQDKYRLQGLEHALDWFNRDHAN